MRAVYYAAMPLILRRFTLTDEAEALAAHAELAADGFDFLGSAWTSTGSWQQTVQLYEDWETGLNLPDGYVPAYSLAADVDGALVGRTSIRLGLNDFLATRGGHIGYAVRPAFRRKGFASAILQGSLELAREYGITRSLVTCDDNNTGSASVIERCGGVLENIVDDPVEGRYRRYWVN